MAQRPVASCAYEVVERKFAIEQLEPIESLIKAGAMDVVEPRFAIEQLEPDPTRS